MDKSKSRSILLGGLIFLVLFDILLFVLGKYYSISLAGKYSFLLVQFLLVIIVFFLYKNIIIRVLCVLGIIGLLVCRIFVSEMEEYNFPSPNKENTIIVQEIPSLKGVRYIVYERKYIVFKKCIKTANIDVTNMDKPFKNNETEIIWKDNIVEIKYLNGDTWKTETVKF